MTDTRIDEIRPRDEQGRFISQYRDVKCFEVTVWRAPDGDVIDKLWEASQAEVDEIQERYEDDPFVDVQVEYIGHD